MDKQLLGIPTCQIGNCENKAMCLLPSGKWACGPCVVKLDKVMKEEKRKYYEILEGKLNENQ